jgi:carboxypeptidase family protein
MHHSAVFQATRLATCISLMLLPSKVAFAQGEISGRVMASDSGRPPLQGVEASIAKLGRTVVSDSLGRFRFKDVPPGNHLVLLRAIGFNTESSTVFIDRDEVVSANIVMTRATSTVLPERRITAAGDRPPAKLVEFTERLQLGVGHFIDQAQLAKAEGGVRQTGDLISTVPGVVVRRGSNKIWVASGRAVGTGCAFCSMSAAALNRADFAAGARPACFMDVYLDGAMVFDSRHPENGLFDVNTIQPEHIGGIEIYSSASQIPAKYNRTGGGCGVVLIWMK